MKTKATVRLKFPSQEQLQVILKSLKPEMDTPATHRTQMTIEKEGMSLVLKTEANDTVALRASLNTYLRWINSILNVIEVLEH